MGDVKVSHVVTSFLMNDEGKVLILRRSDRVGSYHGKWAGVAGYLEMTPAEQAYTEISEEVGLDRADVVLLRQGESLPVLDTELGRRWVVHPFLFRVVHPGKIRLDWEHTESRWIEPAKMGKYPTVPGLVDALRRVLPPPGESGNQGRR